MSDAVLIIDDEKNVLQSLRRLLRVDGYDLHLAEGGPAALEVLAKTEFAVVICDQRMPEMSGAQVLAEAYRLQPDAVRITLTGYTDLLAAQASINEGHITHFILKPWNDDQLRNIVRQSVAAYRLVQENRRLQALTQKQTEELREWNLQLVAKVQEQTDGLRAQTQDLLGLRDRLDRSLRDTVKLVAGMLEVHSPNLGIHCRRVAELARKLGAQLDLDDEALRNLEFAGHLHDIGKLSKLVAETSSQGHGASNAKASRVPPHTEAGYALLAQVSGFEEIALAVRHQHERFGGGGIPHGLRHHDIPLLSRILAVANAYSHAVFSGVSATKVSHQAGCNALRQGRGTLFDPNLVDLLLLHSDDLGVTACHGLEVEVSCKRIRPGMVLSRPVYNLQGLLVLKEGTSLTPDQIESIDRLSDIDPQVRCVFIKCDVEADKAPCGKASSAVPGVQGNGRTMEDGKQRPAAGLQAGDVRRCDVLVVDDSAFLCNALKRELHPDGIAVMATESGWTALELVERNHFDAVLVDLMMPAMPGEELVTRLGQQAPETPCIILTGNATKERVAVLVKKPNVAAILVKPWEHGRLISAITAAIAKSR
jgi:adenylate cyclase